MRRTVLVALCLLASPLAAQITIQHGGSLSEIINNLYGGNGIQLKVTGHQAHFGDSQDFQNFSSTLQRVLQSHPLFPIPSAVGLVSYRFNEQTGTYERIQGALGPLLADRGVTTGKGTLTISSTYTFSDFDQINGRDSVDLTLRHCLLPQCVTNIASPFLQDTINVNVRLRLKSQALTLSTVYGVTNNLDIGLVLPYLRSDLSVATNARIIPGPESVPPSPHEFDLNIETPGQSATGTAVGIGDLVARAKLRILPRWPVDAAVLADVSLPTGDKENFLGTGEVRVKATFVASKVIRKLVPHLNLGYEANMGESKLNTIDYRIGSEFVVREKLTITGDILGVIRPSAESLFESSALGGRSLVGRSEIDGALGGKWQVTPNRAFLFNLLVPMNDRGIRANSVITAGVQVAL
jgi:hypothetical protein